jgi:regulatory protein YycI of two-component signal transduction system YycFG
MDVSKAKTIIIVLLIAFNIFLLANNLIYHNAQGVSSETLENAENILEQRGITLECDIPATAGGSHRLEYIKGGLNRETIAGRLLGDNYGVQDSSVYSNGTKKIIFSGETEFIYTDSMPGSAVKVSDETKAKDAAYRFMKAGGLLDGNYVLDRTEKNDDGSYVFYYIERYEDQLLFDNHFDITLTDKGITRIVYSKYKIKGSSAVSIEQPEVYQTLLAYFKEGSKIVITSIDSGYKLIDETPMDKTELTEPMPVCG